MRSAVRKQVYVSDMEQIEERDLLEQANKVTTLIEYNTWIRRCNECIEQLEERCSAKRPRLTVGHRHSLAAQITRLEGLKSQLERRFTHVGGDYASTARSPELVWREIDVAFESRILTGAVINVNHIEPRQFLENAKDTVLDNVRNVMQQHDNVKINMVFNGEFVAGEKRDNKSVSTRNFELFAASDLETWYKQCVIEPILSSLDEFQERDSGWALSRILNLTVNINKYNPLHAGCNIQLPREIMLKRAVINVQSRDNACFAWAVVAALYPAERNMDRVSSYPHYTTVLNFDGIEFPMSLNHIKKFELLNGISVNIYSVKKKKNERDMKKGEGISILPIRLTKRKMDKHVNLLYIPDPHDDNVGHFTCIKNLSRLIGSQLSNNKRKKFLCDR